MCTFRVKEVAAGDVLAKAVPRTIELLWQRFRLLVRFVSAHTMLGVKIGARVVGVIIVNEYNSSEPEGAEKMPHLPTAANYPLHQSKNIRRTLCFSR